MYYAGRVRKEYGENMMSESLDFYAQHGAVTDPRQFATLFANLPADLESLCTIVQGLLIHPFDADFYGVVISPERLKDELIRLVDRKLARLQELDARPLHEPRTPDLRMANQCYGFAVLL